MKEKEIWRSFRKLLWEARSEELSIQTTVEAADWARDKSEEALRFHSVT
jgi:hypothetical protein